MQKEEPPEIPPAAPVPLTVDGSPYAVFQNRDFRFYITSRFIASLGQQMLASRSAGSFTRARTRCSRSAWSGWRK